MVNPGATRTVDLGAGVTTTLEQWGSRGPALLCVHGIGSSRKSWLRTAEALSDSYCVYAYDQRGHGDSANVAGPMTHAQSVRDLQTVARAIGGDIYALIGHSWGGAIVLLGGRELACERVVAIDPMIRYAGASWAVDFVDDLDDVFAAAPGPRDAVVREMFAGAHPAEIEAKVHAMRTMTGAPIVALGTENRAEAGGWDLRATVRAYPKPLLLLLADQSDSVVSIDDLAFVRAEGGPNVTIEVFEGEGHTLHRSAFERFCRSVARFLGKS